MSSTPSSTPSMADICDGLRRLSGLSPALQEILPRLGDDAFEVDELTRMLSQDPILTARVLRLANSPFYGLSRQIGSLHEAVQVLGFSNLRGLILSAGLISSLSGSDAAAASRSLATAAAAGALAKTLRHDQGLAFTAGLLHNLGALLMGHFAPVPWQALAGDAGEAALDRLARERQLFGYDHCQLGADIVADWHFPAAIQSAIRHYLVPPDDPAETVIDLVHAAWAISADGVGEMSAGVIQRLGLETPDGEAGLAAARQAMSTC